MNEIVRLSLWFIMMLLVLYTVYFVFLSITSFFPIAFKRKEGRQHKFAAVIAARNEEKVVGNLIHSLQQQNYPSDLLDIYVLPNNCTDATREMALAQGARIFDCRRKIRSKGDVLEEFFDAMLPRRRYDAFCIFDADNLVSEDFISVMNQALDGGARIAQGYRDSKNPSDTFISSCYTIYYYMVNRFFNHARSRLGLSAMINGSGFMVSAGLLDQLGGWKTQTMTEDLEFTTQCVLIGEKVHWVPEAVIFDEQPLSFKQSWTQRKRWSTGVIQCLEMYAAPLMKTFAATRRFSCFDMLMFFIGPFMQVLYFSFFSFVFFYALFKGSLIFPQYPFIFQTFFSIPGAFLASFFIAAVVLLLERKEMPRMIKGILTFWFFTLSWIPINILCMIRKQTHWVPIEHTRSVHMNDLVSGKTN